MDTTILEFLSLLREERDKPIDFADMAQLLTLDVLSRITFGKCFGFVAGRKDIFGYSKASEDFLPINELMSNHVFFCGLIGNSIVQKIAAPKKTLMKVDWDTIDGIFYLEGTELAQFDRAVCWNVREWGDNSDLFEPDR